MTSKQSELTTSAAIRQAFIDFFTQRNHEVVNSASLVPANDPTLLFTNAGMVQFKEVFLGHEKRNQSRAVSSQRCVRAGGKHNDLENVGYTARHHTFFEMLGNFSFGDYFKREAIQFAWEFLTKVLQLPKEKLWVTVYTNDDEAADIWLKEIGVDEKRFSRCGEEDNFWSMGDTGPCGPCSEIFYDHGPAIPGGPPGSPEADGDRYIEIWNLVFMQFNRSASGEMTPLPKPSVDTGMGLERLAAVVQGVHSNYEIDLFQNLLRAVSEVTGEKDLTNTSLRVIADHIRSCSFLVVDGVVPSNEGRGYVLRRIIRRAIRHGHKLGVKQAFFHRLVASLVAEMGAAFPELREAQALVEKVLHQEEQQFAQTLDHGLKILHDDLASMSGKEIPGDTIFKLYDTYGFPVDLTGDIARERGLSLDLNGFDAAMAKQRAQSQQAGHFQVDMAALPALEGESEFLGYETDASEARVMYLLQDGNVVESLQLNKVAMVVTDRTPFYAESGGQVGDQGELITDSGVFQVLDTQKQGAVILHQGKLMSGKLAVDDVLHAKVDVHRRDAIRLNHSATHLLHAALRKVLGNHVAQKGSLVDEKRLRFDFSHFDAVTREELLEIERMVNKHIRANYLADTKLMTPDDAKADGAMALFGEKYGEKVRVLTFGDFSKELCGGTHVTRTGDIGFFKITAEMGIAAGVRRIEGCSGEGALLVVEKQAQQLQTIAQHLKAKGTSQVVEKVSQCLEHNRALEKSLAQLKDKLAASQGSDLVAAALDVGDVKLVAARLEGVDPKGLRDTVDQLKNKLKSAVVLLACVQGEKVALVAGVTDNLTETYHAGNLLKHVAQQLGGKGGGRADMAQGGGNDVAALDEALASVQPWVEQQGKS